MSDARQWVTRSDGVRQRYAAAGAPPAPPRTPTPPITGGSGDGDINNIIEARTRAAQNALDATDSHATDSHATDPVDTDYRISHQAPAPEGRNSMANLDDVLPDVVLHPEWYTHWQHPQIARQFPDVAREEREAVALIRAARDTPDLPVTIYRAVPRHVTSINPGDWVSTGPAYASMNAFDEDHHVVSITVPASSLTNEGDVMEWGWQPNK